MSFSITDTFEGPIKKHIDTGLLTKFCINDNIYMSSDGALIDMKNKKILHNFNCHMENTWRHDPFYYYNNIEKHSSNHWVNYTLCRKNVLKNSQNFSEYYTSQRVIQNNSNIYVFDNFDWNNQTSIPYHKLQLNENNKLEIIKLDIKLKYKLDTDSTIFINNDYNIIIINNKHATVLYSLETGEQIEYFLNYYPVSQPHFDKVPYHLLLLKNDKEKKGILFNLAAQKIELESDNYISFSNKYSYAKDNFDCIKTRNKTYVFSIENQPPKKTDAQEAQELREKVEFLEKNNQLITNENTKLKKQNKKLQTQSDSITQEKTEIQVDLQHAEQEIEEYTTQLNEAFKLLEKKKECIDLLKNEYFDELTQSRNTIIDLQKKIDSLKVELNKKWF